MRILFIDLASHDGLLACVGEDRVVTSVPVDHRIADDELIPLFERMLGDAKCKPQDLTHIACVAGPGGFMSLRVAVAFANTLIHQLKIPGAGIHLSDLIAARVQDAKDFFWLHSTKKHELFVCGFGSFASVWPEATHVTVDDFLVRVPSGAAWAGELIPEHETFFRDKKLQRASLRPVLDVLPAFLQKQSFTDALLEPWYGRGW